MESKSLKNLVLSGLFIASGVLLPFITGQIPSIGSKLLPMHIPVLIGGYVFGWQYGLLIGFITPLLRSMLFGMPLMFPVAIAMAFELGAYGLMTGLLYKLFSKKNINIFITLILAMISGRIVWGIVSYILFGIGGTAFSKEMFMVGAFINAIPGIIIQLIIIPIIVGSLKKAKVM